MTCPMARRTLRVAAEGTSDALGNTLKDRLPCRVYRHRKVVSIKRAGNSEIRRECGCDRSLQAFHVAHAVQAAARQTGHNHSIATSKASR